MRSIVLVLACWACVGHCSQAGDATSLSDSSVKLRQYQRNSAGQRSALEAFARLLLITNPAAAFGAALVQGSSWRRRPQTVWSRHCPPSTCHMKAEFPGVEFKTVRIPLQDGSQMAARVYTPEQPAEAVVVFAHGGRFTLGDETADEDVCMALAGSLCGGNLVVVAPNYRQGAKNPHKSGRALADLEDAAMYAREHIAPGLPLGLIGCSSGGYFVLKLTRVLERQPPGFVVAVCPVTNPGLRADYLAACVLSETGGEEWARKGLSMTESQELAFHDPNAAENILNAQDGYFSGDRNVQHAVGAELDQPPFFRGGIEPPPVMLILAELDKNVPMRVVAGVRQWATRELVMQGRGHETCERLPREAQQAIREFVHGTLSIS